MGLGHPKLQDQLALWQPQSHLTSGAVHWPDYLIVRPGTDLLNWSTADIRLYLLSCLVFYTSHSDKHRVKWQKTLSLEHFGKTIQEELTVCCKQMIVLRDITTDIKPVASSENSWEDKNHSSENVIGRAVTQNVNFQSWFWWTLNLTQMYYWKWM